MKGKKGVIFDLDGTLLDTLTDIADSMNAALSRHGFPLHDSDDYRLMVGGGIDVLARRAVPRERRDEDTVSSVVAAMREEYGMRWAATSRPFPGVVEMLAGLACRKILCAVLSNKLDSFTKLMVRSLLGGFSFFQVRGLVAGQPRKPDPRAALEIAQDMRLTPEEMIFVGDSDIDMETGKRAGMTPVGVSWGYQAPEKLILSGACVILDAPGDLLKYL